MPVHVTPVFRLGSIPHLLRYACCHLISNSLAELHEFADRLQYRRDQLRWSRAHMPFFTIGPHSRDIAINFGATPLSRAEVGPFVRLWRIRWKQALARMSKPPPYPKPVPNPF